MGLSKGGLQSCSLPFSIASPHRDVGKVSFKRPFETPVRLIYAYANDASQFGGRTDACVITYVEQDNGASQVQ